MHRLHPALPRPRPLLQCLVVIAGAACAGIFPPPVAATASAAAAQPFAACYTGLAYHRKSGALAFTASYRALGDTDPALRWQVVYRAPDGTVLGRKSLDFSYHDYVPVFTLHLLGPGDMLGIHREGSGEWRMVKRKGPDGEPVGEPFEIRENMAADNGLHPYLLAHFDRLMAGETVPVQVAVPPRQSVVDMRVRRIKDTEIAGRRAVRFRVSVDMLFAGWFTDDLVFTYDPDSRRILAYRGVSIMQKERGKPFPVRVRYYRGDNAPAGTLDAAACGDDRQPPRKAGSGAPPG